MVQLDATRLQHGFGPFVALNRAAPLSLFEVGVRTAALHPYWLGCLLPLACGRLAIAARHPL